MGIVDVVFFQNHFELVIDESKMQKKHMKWVHSTRSLMREGEVSFSLAKIYRHQIKYAIEFLFTI